MEIKRIGVFTSGGDAPGMNACIRAVVRRALREGFEPVGIRRGFAGMIAGEFVEMDRQSVSNILQTGGTILKSARSEVYLTSEGREAAAENLRKQRIEALVAIGGDGTMRGASIFTAEHGIPIVGCPGTIDNDLFGTDETIGFDTALNAALEAIDRIRDTATAHNRLFLIEVMGRDTGFIALTCGIGAGAELILIPETMTDYPDIRQRILSVMSGKERSSIVVVAEGEGFGGAQEIAERFRKDSAFDEIDLRVAVLGHIQRGGRPTARDRLLASRLGAAAVEAIAGGHTDVMVGIVKGAIRLTPMRQAWSRRKQIDYELLELAETIN